MKSNLSILFNNFKTFHFEFGVLNYFNNFKETRFSSKNVTLPLLKQRNHILNEHTHPFLVKKLDFSPVNWYSLIENSVRSNFNPMAQILSQNNLHCLPKPAVVKTITHPTSPFLSLPPIPAGISISLTSNPQVCILLEQSFLQLQGIQ